MAAMRLHGRDSGNNFTLKASKKETIFISHESGMISSCEAAFNFISAPWLVQNVEVENTFKLRVLAAQGRHNTSIRMKFGMAVYNMSLLRRDRLRGGYRISQNFKIWFVLWWVK